MSRFKQVSFGVFLGLAGMITCTSRANAGGGPVTLDAGFHFNLQSPDCKQHLGPWYTYFPYEAYFQVPPPVGNFPHWPTPFPPVGVGTGQAPGGKDQQQGPQLNPQQNPFSPPRNPGQTQGPNLQTVGYYYPAYYYGMQVPYYWYGR